MENSAPKSAPGKPFRKGDDPRRRPGPHPGAGRPANEFRAQLRALLADPKVKKSVKVILRNPDHPQFAAMWGKVADQGHGKALQAITFEGEAPPIRILRDQAGAVAEHEQQHSDRD